MRIATMTDQGRFVLANVDPEPTDEEPLLAINWDESEHPRAEDGKFSEGGGGGEGQTEQDTNPSSRTEEQKSQDAKSQEERRASKVMRGPYLVHTDARHLLTEKFSIVHTPEEMKRVSFQIRKYNGQDRMIIDSPVESGAQTSFSSKDLSKWWNGDMKSLAAALKEKGATDETPAKGKPSHIERVSRIEQIARDRRKKGK